MKNQLSRRSENLGRETLKVHASEIAKYEVWQSFLIVNRKYGIKKIINKNKWRKLSNFISCMKKNQQFREITEGMEEKKKKKEGKIGGGKEGGKRKEENIRTLGMRPEDSKYR